MADNRGGAVDNKRWTLVNREGEVEGSDSESSSSSLEVLNTDELEDKPLGGSGGHQEQSVVPEMNGDQGEDSDSSSSSLEVLHACELGNQLPPGSGSNQDQGVLPAVNGDQGTDSESTTSSTEVLHADELMEKPLQSDGSHLDQNELPETNGDQATNSEASTPEVIDGPLPSEETDHVDGPLHINMEGGQSTETVNVPYQRQSSEEDFETIEEDTASLPLGNVDDVKEGVPPVVDKENQEEQAPSDEEFIKVPGPDPAAGVAGPSGVQDVSQHGPFLHLQRRKRNSGDTDSTDSDFVRLEPSMAEDMAPPMMQHSGSSTSSSVSQGFFFFRRGYRREDEDDLLPGDVDDRCESDISGVAGDDDSDLSTKSDCLGDIPLTAENVPRSYRHRPNSNLSATLTKLSLLVLFTGIGIGIGHFIGTSWDIPDNQMEIDILNNKLDACDKSAKLLDYQLKETQRDLEALQLDRQRVVLETGQSDLMKDKQIKLLMQESQDLQRDKDKLNEELISLRSSLEELEQKNRALNVLNLNAEYYHEQWEEELEKNRALQEEIRSVGQVLEQQQEQTSILQNILEELNKEITQLRSQAEMYNPDQTSPYDNQLNTLNEKVAILEEENHKLKEELQISRNAYKDAKTALLFVNQQRDKSTALTQTLQQRVNELATENMELRGEIGKTRYATNSEAEEKAKVVALTQTLQQRLNDLATENAELREEVGKTRYATSSAEKSAQELALMKRQMTTLHLKYDRLKSSRAALQQNSQEHRQVCEDMNAECPSWAEKGECTKSPQYMHIYCKESCGICGNNEEPTPKEKAEKESTLKDKIASLQKENDFLRADINSLKESVLETEREKNLSETDLQELKSLLETMEKQLSSEKNRAGMFEKLYIALQDQQSKSKNQTFNASLFNCINALVSTVKVNMSEVIRTANFTFLNDASKYIQNYQGLVQNMTQDTQFAEVMAGFWQQLKGRVGTEKMKEYFDKVQKSYENLQKTVKSKWDAYTSDQDASFNDERKTEERSDSDDTSISVPDMIGKTLHKTISKVQDFSQKVVNDHQQALQNIRTSLTQLKEQIQENWMMDDKQSKEEEMNKDRSKGHREIVAENGYDGDVETEVEMNRWMQGHRHHKHSRYRRHHHKHHRHGDHGNQHISHHGNNRHRQSHHSNQNLRTRKPPSPKNMKQYYYTYAEEYDPHLQKWVYAYTSGDPFDHIDSDHWQLYTDLEKDSPVHERKVDRIHRDTKSELHTEHEEQEPPEVDLNQLLLEGFSEGNNRKSNKQKKNFKKILGRFQRFNEESLVTLDEDDLEDMYEDFEEYIEDTEDMEISDKLRTWLTCQERWWKGRLHRKHRDQDLIRGCGSNLMRWQLRVICKEACSQDLGRCDLLCQSLGVNCPQAQCSGDKRQFRRHGATQTHRSAEESRPSSSHYNGGVWHNTTNPDDAWWYFRRAQDRENHLSNGRWYFRRSADGKYHYRFVRSRSPDDPSWYFRRAHDREYQHHKTSWVFQRAADREFHRQTPDDWYFRRHGTRHHRRG